MKGANKLFLFNLAEHPERFMSCDGQIYDEELIMEDNLTLSLYYD